LENFADDDANGFDGSRGRLSQGMLERGKDLFTERMN
jgi:hypothetical protein